MAIGPGPAPLPNWERFVELKDSEDGSTMDGGSAERETRIKVAEVFKQAARVYLHSVIEGCDPQIPIIRQAVRASIQALTVRVSRAFRRGAPTCAPIICLCFFNFNLFIFYSFAGIALLPTRPRARFSHHDHWLPGRDAD